MSLILLILIERMRKDVSSGGQGQGMSHLHKEVKNHDVGCHQMHWHLTRRVCVSQRHAIFQVGAVSLAYGQTDMCVNRLASESS